MDSDEVNQTHRETLQRWQFRLSEYNTAGIERLASGFRDGEKCECTAVRNGSFNWCFKVIFNDGTAWAVRIPAAGNVMYPEEKIRREVAILQFLKEKTRIPVPEVVAFGMAADNHDPEMGPFLIMEWIEGVPLSSIMEELPRPDWGPVLRQDISDDKLRWIYSQMADILLELSTQNFERIGALTMARQSDGIISWDVEFAPMTLKMNEIERAGYVKAGDHAAKPFRTVTEYFEHLVEQNIKHLLEQRNSIDDEDDAERKFILRQRVKHIIPHFVSAKYNDGPFKLFCCDFRPGNILFNEMTGKIVLIDVEWMYSAPFQFLFSPPSWLTLEDPISWTTDGEARYQEKFGVFLQCLEALETERESEGHAPPERLSVLRPNPPHERLSVLMRQSMHDGKFWFNELLRQSFNFDEEVLWPNIDQHLKENGFGDFGQPSQPQVETFVRAKLQELSQYKLDLRARGP